MLEHGAYTLLLDRYYATEQPIPADQAHRVARARSVEERAAVDAVLAEFFKLVDGCYMKGRVQEEIQQALHRIETARANGKSGGRPKKNPAGFGAVLDRKPSGFESGSQNETGSKALQAPPPSLQAEDQNLPAGGSAREGEKPNGTQRVSVQRGTSGHRLPDDFTLTPERRAYAVTEGVDADRTFAKFCDHWRAASTANARKRDWDAAWRNWCRGEKDRIGLRPAPFLVNGSDAERKAAMDAAWEKQKVRARAIGFRMPLAGEAIDNYRAAIDRETPDNRRGPQSSTHVLAQLGRS